jgi:RNA polymerase sigma-70 factor (ECF subfamily)
VFIKVHQHLARFKFQSKLSTWIAQITYRTALNYLKKQKRNLISVPTKPIEDVFLSSENIEQKLNDLDVAAYLEKLIAQLPEQYKLVLTLYHLKEFSYQEIEVITGMPEGTVKSYLFRARKMLKDKLANYLKNEQV